MDKLHEATAIEWSGFQGYGRHSGKVRENQ